MKSNIKFNYNGNDINNGHFGGGGILLLQDHIHVSFVQLEPVEMKTVEMVGFCEASFHPKQGD